MGEVKDTQVSLFLNDFFSPEVLNSFQAPLDENPIVVYIFRSPDQEPEQLILSELFPFMTLQDIKTLIYKKKASPAFAPRFQSILVPIQIEEESIPNVQSDIYNTVDYYWIDPNVPKNAYKSHSHHSL